jgi:hypothetical protein
MPDRTLPHGRADDASIELPPQLNAAPGPASDADISTDDDAATPRTDELRGTTLPFLVTHWMLGIGGEQALSESPFRRSEGKLDVATYHSRDHWVARRE